MNTLNNVPCGVSDTDYEKQSPKLHAVDTDNGDLSELTFDKLMVVLVKAVFTENIDPDIKSFILFAAQKNGLVDDRREMTPAYFARINEDLEKLIRNLSGYRKKASGLCACGCGRDPKGRGKYATAACRKKASRTSKRIKKEAA